MNGNLTPESETYRAALSSAVAAFFGHHVRVGAITHFNAETVKQIVRDMCEPAYKAGREDAARDIESVPWHDEGIPTAVAAAELARGEAK